MCRWVSTTQRTSSGENPAPRSSGQFRVPTALGVPGSEPDTGSQPSGAYLPVPDSITGVALPVTARTPFEPTPVMSIVSVPPVWV